jgi:hypothetical protein
MGYRFFTAICAALLLSCCCSAEAQVYRNVVNTRPARAAYQPGTVLWRSGWKGPPPPYTHPEYYQYLNERYPKFYGAFHSSYFHNMGLPPGDIGPRGNGIYPTPW